MMKSIRPLYKQHIFNLLTEKGFDPTSFESRETIEYFKIQYKGSNLYFAVHPTDVIDRFKTAYSAYLPKFSHKGHPYVDPIPLATLLNLIAGWLRDHVSKYIEDQSIIDPWDALEQASANERLLSLDISTSEEKFKKEEIKMLEPALDVLKNKLENTDFDKTIQEQLKKFVDDLNEIKADLKILKKKSWFRQYSGLAWHLMTFAYKESPELFDSVKEWLKEFMDNFQQPLIS
jgi:hypothetical protein